jgi:cytochrome c-type biogenesis protein
MTDIPLALALAAGMVAAVNPCGFALLPAYVSFLVLGDGAAAGTPSAAARRAAVGRALLLTGSMTVGFVAVFGAFGLLVAPAASAVQQRLPWFTIVLGLVLAGLGGWLLAGRTVSVPGLKVTRGISPTRTAPSMVLFGMFYAAASLGCTIGPFLAIVGSSFRAGSAWAALGLFGAYAAGMGLVVGAVSLAVALARGGLVSRLRRAGGLLTRAGGGLLLLAGAYVAYYGWWEIRVFRGAATTDPVVGAAEGVQRWLAGGVERLGAGGIAVLFALLLVAGLAGARARRRQAPPVAAATGSDAAPAAPDTRPTAR